MLFKSITVNNMFAYYGKQTLEFGFPKDGCNITLLMGNNGYGKTSFINSVKMLFLGEKAEEIRRTIQSRRVLSPKQFVIGIEHEWWGILNHKARSQDENFCSVTAIWDDEGYEVKVIRSWKIDFIKKNYETDIQVFHPARGILRKEDAGRYLESCLPGSYIPFFFFDGEEIQHLAESDSSHNIEKMEMLLNIKPLDNIQQTLKDLANSLKREAADTEAKKELQDAEREISGRKDDLAVLQQKQRDIQTKIDDATGELEQIRRHLRLLRIHSSEQEESSLKRQADESEKQKKQSLEELASYWRRDALLAVNFPLLKKFVQKLKPQLDSNAGELQELLSMVEKRLLSMFDTLPYPSPRLLDNQVEFYKQRIISEIGAFKVSEKRIENFSISHERANALLQQMLNYENGGGSLQTINTLLDAAYTASKNILKINEKLKNVESLTEQERARYKQLLSAEEKYIDNCRNYQDENYATENKIGILIREITERENKLGQLYDRLESAQKSRKKHDFIELLRTILGETKKKLKTQKRKELEDYYNNYLTDLFSSNSLINKVEVDENFAVRYKDQDDNEIGKNTISAGMKQLSATALLWALKSASKRQIPVIIDTPMGRIDNVNQQNLLKKYYPKVAEQLVLLPTDSELDKNKYSLLKPYICSEYLLRNPSGKSAVINKVESVYG